MQSGDMASLRRLAWMCRTLPKQHVDDPDVSAVPEGASGYAEWVQVALILYRVGLKKSLCGTEDSLNEVLGILAVFGLNEARCVQASRAETRRWRGSTAAGCPRMDAHAG